MDDTLAYRDGRVRLTALLRGVDDGIGDLAVPCCPIWSVKDVVAHVCGIGADVLAGNMAGVTTDAWTDAQVAARSGQTLAQVLDEWDHVGPQVDALFAGGEPPGQLVFDFATHEHDLRHAIDAPGARDAASTHIALGWVLDTWPKAYDRSCPPLRIDTGDRQVDVGIDASTGAEPAARAEPEVTLRLEPFEALRALTGRRSVGQLTAYAWDTDPAPWLPRAFTWGPLRPSAIDIIE